MKNLAGFQKTVWDYYVAHKRDLPWRIPEPDATFDPYKILVSEMMLQQTQVGRVSAKYDQFLKVFPSMRRLAEASLAEVLVVWQGLGYNRRARFLHEAAKQLVGKNDTWKQEDLLACKGIGPNTAAAVMVYTYNRPEVFIETNIRSVYLHHFFRDHSGVADKQILELVEQTIDKQNPREWYWALMDYGGHIKKTHGNPNTASKHYSLQTPFAGSVRQLRGEVLRQLTKQTKTLAQLQQNIVDDRLGGVLAALCEEKMVTKTGTVYKLG